MHENRTEIEERYKWDLSLVLDSDESFLKLINEIQTSIPLLEKFKGTLNVKENIVNYFELSRGIDLKLSRAHLYAFLKYEANSLEASNLKHVEMVENLCVKLSASTSFVRPELSKLDDNFLIALKKDSELSDYDRIFEDLLRNKPHTLSEEQEKLISEMGAFSDFSAVYDMLTDNEIRFDDVVARDGTVYTLNQSSYGELIRSQDQDLRKQSHINLLKGFKNVNKTLAVNYINHLKKCNFYAKTYNYKNCFSMSLFNEEVEEDVYNSLITSVHSHLSDFYNFVQVKKDILGLDEFNIYDSYAPIGNAKKFSLEYDKAYSIVIEALNLLGSEYTDVLKTAYSNRWIDVYHNEGKRSGAFSISTETGNPFVLLNFKPTYNDISTIAHEMGHSMHSYFSEKAQPHEKRKYEIFVAEIASTVNEILLFKYLLKQENDNETRKFLISSFLENFYATVYRQTMFSEFEYFAHSKTANEEPLSFDELNNYYQQLLELYFGKDTAIHDCAKFEWSRISHFYRPFYVFKYATGYISALAIVENIEREGQRAVDNYIKFLSGGCSKKPSELLNIAGVDILDPKTFESAFNYYGSMIEELRGMKN